MKNTTPFVRAIPLPRKYVKPGVLTLEVVEYSMRSRLMSNGYWITLAAIVIPSLDKTVFGASACSPEDEWSFDRADAANRALGRAKQVAFRLWSGRLAGMTHPATQDTLFGKELDAIYPTPSQLDFVTIQALAEPLFDIVANHAMYVAAIHEQKLLNQSRYFTWSFVPRVRMSQP